MHKDYYDELPFEQLNDVLASIKIPVCPAIVTQAMAEAQKDFPNLVRLSQLISGDVSTAAFTLKLANSSHFSRGEAISSIKQAIARLGTSNIVSMVVAAVLRSSTSFGLPADFLESFWQRSSLVACAAALTARHLQGVNPDTAYIYGLFHDAAVPVMMQRFDDYAAMLRGLKDDQSSLPDSEMGRYQCTHAQVGGLLAHNWHLPRSIVRAIRHHHDTELHRADLKLLTDEELGLIAAVHLAEHLLSELLGEHEGETAAMFEMAVDYFGLHDEDLTDIREALLPLTQ